MKKIITMAICILITAFIAAFAGDKPTPQKQSDYQISFNRIVVYDDIDLQLKESDSRNIAFAGKEADVENIDWKIKDNVLYLQSKKGSLKDKVKVQVTVDQLKEIVVKGQSVVSSNGALLSPRLDVYVHSDCYVALKNTGEIHVIEGAETEINVKTMKGDVRLGK